MNLLRLIFNELLLPARNALKRFWLAFLLIQICGAIFVILYYQSPQVQAWCEQIMQTKNAVGIPFAIMLGILSGAIIPEIFKLITGTSNYGKKGFWGELAFTAFLFGSCMVINDFFFALQVRLFGDELEWHVIARKILFDQLVYVPLVLWVYVITVTLIREQRGNIILALKQWSWALYKRRVFPGYVASFCYWTPIITCMYALPLSLQLTFAAFASAAWSLILMSILKTAK